MIHGKSCSEKYRMMELGSIADWFSAIATFGALGYTGLQIKNDSLLMNKQIDNESKQAKKIAN